MISNRAAIERFWSKVDQSAGPGECHLWMGYRNEAGYGQFWNGKGHVYAHRFAYVLVKGVIPSGRSLDHMCHNKGCVNPKHLRPVTDKQNQENRQGPSRNSKTGVRGVVRTGNRFRARVRHNGKTVNAGYFCTLKEADAAARAKRLELFTHNDVDRPKRHSHPTHCGRGVVREKKQS